jgi:hypothetical protein
MDLADICWMQFFAILRYGYQEIHGSTVLQQCIATASSNTGFSLRFSIVNRKFKIDRLKPTQPRGPAKSNNPDSNSAQFPFREHGTFATIARLQKRISE